MFYFDKSTVDKMEHKCRIAHDLLQNLSILKISSCVFVYDGTLSPPGVCFMKVPVMRSGFDGKWFATFELADTGTEK